MIFIDLHKLTKIRTVKAVTWGWDVFLSSAWWWPRWPLSSAWWAHRPLTPSAREWGLTCLLNVMEFSDCRSAPVKQRIILNVIQLKMTTLDYFISVKAIRNQISEQNDKKKRLSCQVKFSLQIIYLISGPEVRECGADSYTVILLVYFEIFLLYKIPALWALQLDLFQSQVLL